MEKFNKRIFVIKVLKFVNANDCIVYHSDVFVYLREYFVFFVVKYVWKVDHNGHEGLHEGTQRKKVFIILI